MIEKVSKVYSINNFFPKKQKESKDKQKKRTLIQKDSLILSAQYKDNYEEKRDIKYVLFLQNHLNEMSAFLQNTVITSLINKNESSEILRKGIESVFNSMCRRFDGEIVNLVIQKDRALTKAYNSLSQNKKTLEMMNTLRVFTGNENIFHEMNVQTLRLENIYWDENNGETRVYEAINYLNTFCELVNELAKEYYKKRLQV